MHLTGQAHAADLISADPGRGQDALDRLLCRLPPVLGALLGPQRLLHAHVFVRRREAGLDRSLFIHQQCACAAGSDVDA